MFKLPALPSPRSQIHELADFAELLALQQGTVSAREILAYLGRVSENDPNEGIDDEDDKARTCWMTSSWKWIDVAGRAREGIPSGWNTMEPFFATT